MSIVTALFIHCLCILMMLLLLSFCLYKRQIFSLNSSGVWVLFSSFLCFLLNPAIYLLFRSNYKYDIALSLYTRGGVERVLWVLFLLFIGHLSFFVFYLKNHPSKYSLNRFHIVPKKYGWTFSRVFIVIIFLTISFYSLLALRTRGYITDYQINVDFDDGRIIGGSTGYIVSGYKFLLPILIYLILKGPSKVRYLGWLLSMVFISFRVLDTHDRASMVSFIIALAIVVSLGKNYSINMSRYVLYLRRPGKKRYKMIFFMMVAAIMTIFLVFRGHGDIVTRLDNIKYYSTRDFLSTSDTDMLPAFYEWSWAFETYGFDYGLPVINRALFGWLPRIYFPWKDDLPSYILGKKDIRRTREYEKVFLNPKATVIGSFYGNGGIIGIIFGMSILGILFRKLDILFYTSKTLEIKVFSIVLISEVWIGFISDSIFILTRTFFYFLPCMFLIFTNYSGKKEK